MGVTGFLKSALCDAFSCAVLCILITEFWLLINVIFFFGSADSTIWAGKSGDCVPTLENDKPKCL